MCLFNVADFTTKKWQPWQPWQPWQSWQSWQPSSNDVEFAMIYRLIARYMDINVCQSMSASGRLELLLLCQLVKWKAAKSATFSRAQARDTTPAMNLTGARETRARRSENRRARDVSRARRHRWSYRTWTGSPTQRHGH